MVLTGWYLLQALCQLTLDFCCVTGDQSRLKSESLDVLKRAEWGQLLSRYKVSYTRAFKGGGHEAKIGVGTALLLNREVDVDTILNFYQ